MPRTGWLELESATSREGDHDPEALDAADSPTGVDESGHWLEPGDGLGSGGPMREDAETGESGRGSGSGAVAGRGKQGWDHEADRWLVEQAVAGHGQAFEVLLRRHQDRIYGIALRMLGDPSAAEDVAQDVAIQLWRVLATFTGASRFTTWLYRIVVNRCLNHQRAGRVTGRDTRPLLDSEHPRAAGPEQRALDSARLDAASAALASLPPEQRTALVLCQIEGMSYREAATIINVSEPALRSRLERARKNLLAAMREWM